MSNVADCIYCRGNCVRRVKDVKYLGVFIDEQLSWNIHINDVHKKLRCLIGVLYKVRLKLPKEVLKAIYFAYVSPVYSMLLRYTLIPEKPIL